jgi:hypothetical protein
MVLTHTAFMGEKAKEARCIVLFRHAQHAHGDRFLLSKTTAVCVREGQFRRPGIRSGSKRQHSTGSKSLA